MPRGPARGRSRERAGRRAGPRATRRAAPVAPTASTGPTALSAAAGERLQKYLARAGFASRREAEGWIRAGRLSINGQPATLGARVGTRDQVRLDGRLVHAPAVATGTARAFICHRSPGEPLQSARAGAEPQTPEAPSRSMRMTHAHDPAAGPRVALLERLPRRAGRRFIAISPMPLPDGGLELVTPDGELAARLQRSVHALSSEFGVRVRGELSASQLQAILGGTLDSGAQLVVERCEAAGGEGANRWYTLVASGASGKDVRQLFERQGALVSRVMRTRLGGLALERALSRGQFRQLSAEELAALTAGGAAAEETGVKLSPGRRRPER
jgi:23S rRNA pseudouridine2605 synthase